MKNGEVSLSELAEGAVQERFAIEFSKVLANIMDPNTDHKKKRKLQLNLTFESDENRDIALLQVDAKTTLAPAKGIATKILMDRDNYGNAVGAEFIQTALFGSGKSEEVGNVTPINQKTGGK